MSGRLKQKTPRSEHRKFGNENIGKDFEVQFCDNRLTSKNLRHLIHSRFVSQYFSTQNISFNRNTLLETCHSIKTLLALI
jgi:hypothetical protein